MRRAIAVAALLLLAGCFPRASIPDEERQRAARELAGQVRHARVALFVGPFFGDGSKLLATDQPAGELDLLETPQGEPIAPPPPERVVLPGTPLRITSVEFPTGLVFARRVVMTPRHHPWVYLALDGESRPLVVVLPQGVATAEDVRAELDRYLGSADAGMAYAALPEEQRTAIGRKAPVEGMAPQALEMAWGYPERKVIDRPAGTEEWSWPGGKRTASFRGGKLVRWTEPR